LESKTSNSRASRSSSFGDTTAPATPLPTESTAYLKWIPLPLDGSIGPPPGLKDFQVGWWWNLFCAALMNRHQQGYLNVSRDRLWIVAGSHHRAYWDANSAEVMEAFELREIAGREMWCLPALVQLVEEQRKKLRHREPREGGPGLISPSPSQSPSASDLKDQKQNQQQMPSTARARSPAEACTRSPAQHCAARMIEVLSLASTSANFSVIAAAITAESDFAGIPLEEAAQAIADHAMRARTQGVAIDRFYFEDTKWRHKHKSKSEVATDEFAQRIEREREILRRAGGS
jgi:hypothetical protein